MDECYDRNVGTEAIFAQEIKPLISGVFGGENSTIFAYGPRGSGKTYTIQVSVFCVISLSEVLGMENNHV